MAALGPAVEDPLNASAIQTPRLRAGDTAVVRIDSLAAGGAGVAHLPDGRVVFVPRTAPGDRARVRVVRVHSRWATAEAVELLEAAGTRVAPPCPLFGACGGCTLQHIPYPEQRQWKGRFVADAMARIGGVEVAPDRVVASPDTLGYRNRLTFTLRRLGGGRVLGGFHGAERPGFIVDVPDCLLAEDSVREAWSALRKGWGRNAEHLPPGRTLRLTLRGTESGVVTLLVTGGRPGWNAVPLARSSGLLATIWHQSRGAARPARVAGAVQEQESWLDDTFPVEGRAFLQVNRAAAVEVSAYVLEQAGSGHSAVDAYCGVGVYGRALARRSWTATGLEVDPAACTAARHQAPRGFEVLEGTVEENLSRRLPADLVILNPPRTGLHPDVPVALLAAGVPRVVYVSCDPPTLARDTRLLGRDYRLQSLRSFDFFPQTAHVETVATFAYREAA